MISFPIKMVNIVNILKIVLGLASGINSLEAWRVARRTPRNRVVSGGRGWG